jgi:UDP-N-acetylmuramoylalanine--D-glutamate ligase
MEITRDYFDDKKVLVFGVGTNGGGLGTVQFLLSTKAKSIHLVDQKTSEELQDTLIRLPKDPRLHEHFALPEALLQNLFAEVDIVIKNPGITWHHPLLLLAQESGAEVIMDSTLFMALCPAPVIGVTGSKGKTTTASLVAHILETAGHQVVRVGISQTGVLSELPKVTKESVVVFELSSWRLSGLAGIAKSPKISIITNLYPDHLNYYGTMEEYARDKKYSTDFQSTKDTLVVSGKNEWTKFFTDGTKAAVKMFGSDTSDAWQTEQALVLAEADGDCEVLQKKQSFLKGEHFFDNILAASLATRAFGVSLEVITKALQTFRGVPHRFELVREIGGVQYINDTAATIPSATLASVQAVSTPVILLAGGSDKGLPLAALLEAMSRAKKTFLFAGNGTDKILAELPESEQGKVVVVHSMEEAVERSWDTALPGETVLLAPGAASFGMFQNEFDRGEQFVHWVKNL